MKSADCFSLGPLLLWLLYSCCFFRSLVCVASAADHSIKKHFDYDYPDHPFSSVDRSFFFFDSTSPREEAPEDEVISNSSTSDSDPEEREDEVPDASSSAAAVARQADLLRLHSSRGWSHRTAGQQSLSGNSYQSSLQQPMIDELLVQPSGAGEASADAPQHRQEDLSVAAGRHFRQQDGGHQGFFQ